MSKSRKDTWITLIVVVVSIPIAAVIGIVTFVSITESNLHPNPQDVKSVMLSAPSPRWADAVERARLIARTSVSEQSLPGISVAVGVGQETVWAEGFGWADIANQTPVTPAMQFRIGHVSKALTSAAVGLLLEKGRLRLDDEIQAYVPAFPKKQWPVTLRQLMGHVAGVRHYRDTEWGDKPSARCEQASEGLRTFAQDPLLFEPGTRYSYSTYGWVLVSAAVEAAAAEPLFTFMRTRIFEPLGMSDTTFESGTEPTQDRVTPYYRNNFGRELSPGVDYSCFAGAGAFWSTPSDLVRFGIAINNGELLQPATVRMLQTPQQLASGKETEYGLGWMLDTTSLAGEPTRLAGHASRTMVGASTSFLTFPGRGRGKTIVVAVTANISFADARSIALRIAEAFADQARKQSIQD